MFVGDLVDRGPCIVPAARIVMRMVGAGSALCVPGNHDVELLRCLEGKESARSLGTRRSIQQIESLTPAGRRRFVQDLAAFVRSLPPHLVLDDGRLAVAHAGLKTEHVGRDSEEVRRFALHGETTGAVDRYGLPVRVKWAAAYRGRTLVVYGHTPVKEPEWLNRYGPKYTAPENLERLRSRGLTAKRSLALREFALGI